MLWILLIIVCLISAFTRVFERSAGLLAFLLMGYMVGTPNYQFNNDAFVYLNSYLSKADNFERGYNWLTDLAATHVSYATFRLYYVFGDFNFYKTCFKRCSFLCVCNVPV